MSDVDGEHKGLKRPQNDDGDQPSKKAKTLHRAEEVVVIADDDGALVIPDDD
mgnify:CR=1 FL=1